MALGARTLEGRGSRVRFELNYSGKLMLRVSPEVHAAVATAAQVSGKSINQWAAEAFTKAVRA